MNHRIHPNSLKNLRLPKDYSYKRTDEYRKKMSVSKKGFKHSVDSKIKMSLVKLGKPKSESTKNKIRKTIIEKGLGFKKGNKLKKGIKPWNFGVPLTQEQKDKLSKSWDYDKHNTKEIREKQRLSIIKKWETDKQWVEKQLKRYKENPPKKGKTVSIKGRINISKSKTGVPNLKLRGIPRSKETIEKIKLAREKQVFSFKDSKPERMMQIALSLHRIKFEKHKILPGQPDIFIEPNICIFVDGQYWHADPRIYQSDSIMKKGYTAKQIWDKDLRFNHKLNSMGYQVIRIWEKDIKDDANRCAENIIKLIEQVRGKIII